MTLFEAYVAQLQRVGMEKSLATLTVQTFQAKGIINKKLWDTDAATLPVDTILAGMNAVRQVTVVEITNYAIETITKDSKIPRRQVFVGSQIGVDFEV